MSRASDFLDELLENVESKAGLSKQSKCYIDTEKMSRSERMFHLDDDDPEKIAYKKECKKKNINPDNEKPWRSEASKNYRGSNSPNFKKLKKHKKPMTTEERDLVRTEKAEWSDKRSAVFKSVIPGGKTWYTTNTHRCYNTSNDLNLTIDRFHDFVKGTA